MASLVLERPYNAEEAYNLIRNQLKHPRIKGTVNRDYSLNILTSWGEIAVTIQNNSFRMSYKPSVKLIVITIFLCELLFPFYFIYQEYQTMKELEEDILRILNNA